MQLLRQQAKHCNGSDTNRDKMGNKLLVTDRCANRMNINLQDHIYLFINKYRTLYVIPYVLASPNWNNKKYLVQRTRHNWWNFLSPNLSKNYTYTLLHCLKHLFSNTIFYIIWWIDISDIGFKITSTSKSENYVKRHFTLTYTRMRYEAAFTCAYEWNNFE